jgi:hypothetical protein
LRLGEAGLAQSFRDFQGIDRHLEQPEPNPSAEAGHDGWTMARTGPAQQAAAEQRLGVR